MNYRKVFIFIFIAIAAFTWFSLKQKRSESSKNKTDQVSNPAVSVDQPSVIKVQKPTSPGQEVVDPNGFNKCYSGLWREFKVDECNNECFKNYMENFDPDLAKLIDEKWTDKSFTNRRAYSQYGLLLRSLQNAGLNTEPLPEEKTDMDLALAQISQLASDDPGNGYPLLFSALLFNKRGRTQEATQYLKAASEAPQFNSYLGNLKKRLLLATADDPRMYLKAIQLFSQMPIPDYRELEKLIGINDEALQIVLQRMTSKAVEVGGKGFELNWNPLEHQISILVLKKIAPNEAERIPNYREILDRTENPLGDESHWKFNEEKCSKEEFIEELQREKLFLQTLN